MTPANVSYLPAARAARGQMSAASPNAMAAYGRAASYDADGDHDRSEPSEIEDAGEANREPYEAPYDAAQLVEMFEEAEMASIEARRAAERCRDYYDNKQLTAEERKVLAERGQPEVIRNHIRGKVNFWLGFEAKNRSDPKAESEHGTTEDEASDATDMLRFQERRADLDQKFSDCWENMLIEGYAGLEVLGPDQRDERVVEVKRWRWDRLFYDPASQEHDFSDATYVGGVVWMDEKKAKREYAGKEGEITRSAATSLVRSSGTYDDKPRHITWATGAAGRVRILIVQIYYVCDGQWHWAHFTQGGILDAGPVELTDEQGNSVCPMIMQALYIDRNNNRYGEVAEFLSPQDEINKHASKALHRLNSTLTIGEQGAGLDVDEIKAQKARPDGHINLPPGAMDKFKFVEHSTQVAQGREMMMDAVGSIEKRGPNAALMGHQGGAPSGRAIRANQEGGMIEGARPRDRYNNLKTRVYRAMWQRVRQFCTAETWVSITSDDTTVRHVGFNRPVTMRDKLIEDARKDGMSDEQIAQELQAVEGDPRLDQVVGTENVPMEMDLNIIIEPATESVTMAHEAFEMLAARQDVPFEMLLEFWPGSARQKKKIRDAMEKMRAGAAQAEAEAAALKADNLKSQTEKNRASAMKDMSAADESHVAARMAPDMARLKAEPPMASDQIASGSPYAVA